MPFCDLMSLIQVAQTTPTCYRLFSGQRSTSTSTARTRMVHVHWQQHWHALMRRYHVSSTGLRLEQTVASRPNYLQRLRQWWQKEWRQGQLLYHRLEGYIMDDIYERIGGTFDRDELYVKWHAARRGLCTLYVKQPACNRRRLGCVDLQTGLVDLRCFYRPTMMMDDDNNEVIDVDYTTTAIGWYRIPQLLEPLLWQSNWHPLYSHRRWWTFCFLCASTPLPAHG